MQKLEQIQVIAFDADDTLWVNETFFRDAESLFCDLLSGYLPAAEAFQILYETEMKNLPLYGYGIKPFTLSLIEAAVRISQGKLPTAMVEQLLDVGKEMLNQPVELLPGIEETLAHLAKDYRLVVATKGDLLDQERKLNKSGLQDCFHHIEIVSDKTPTHYQKLVNHLDIDADEFLMVGNSPRSDILPVLEIGAHAFLVPFHTTWVHEIPDEPIVHPNYRAFDSVRDILDFL